MEVLNFFVDVKNIVPRAGTLHTTFKGVGKLHTTFVPRVGTLHTIFKH